METTIKQCDKSLNFKPLTPWPKALPAIAYKGELWSGFELGPEHPVWNWTTGNALETFKGIYPRLTLPEVARLGTLSSAYLPQADIAALYGVPWTETTQQIFAALVQCPSSFQDWVAEKAIGPQELGIFMSVSAQQLTPALQKIVNENLSRQNGIQALELFGELLLLNHEIENLTSGQGDAWLKNLRQQRFPLTQKKDLAAEKSLSHLPWPTSVQSKWVRRGDKGGVEIKFFVATPLELSRTLQNLRKLEETLPEGGSW